MSAEDERFLALRRIPGAIDNLGDSDREAVRTVRDTQLERGMDLLKGINLFTNQGKDDGKVAAQQHN
jgi:hypothetical protein